LFYTMRCPSSCRMCVTGSSPQNRNKMSLEEALSYVQLTSSISTIRWISINGGEPLLFFDEIRQVLSLAKQNGKRTKVSSNGFWARSPRIAQQKIRELKTAGLDFISLSTDDYHQQFIPIENIRYSLEAAEHENIMREVTIIVDQRSAHKVMKLVRLLNPKVEEMMIGKMNFIGQETNFNEVENKTVVDLMPLQPFGRGAKLLQRCILHELDTFYGQPCTLVGKFPYVMPGGRIYWCCNFFAPGAGYVERFQIGNLGIESLAEVDQRLKRNLMVDLLAHYGPLGLPWLLASTKYTNLDREKYASLCDLCIDVSNRHV
jgi:organic radical activating enzyme